MGFVGVVVMSTAKTMNIAILGSCLFGFLFSNTANIFSIASEVVPRRHRGTAQIATNLVRPSFLSLFLFVWLLSVPVSQMSLSCRSAI